MSTNKTHNLGLHSWVRSDHFRMDEFNENFDKLDQAVGEKAEKTALETLAGQVAGKAEKTALEALTGQVEALEQGRLRWKCDSYVGNGDSGRGNPCRLEFDFKPLMLIINAQSSPTYGGSPWIRGMTRGVTVVTSTTYYDATLTWEDRAVEWINSNVSDTAAQRLNAKGSVYYYIAVGTVE